MKNLKLYSILIAVCLGFGILVYENVTYSPTCEDIININYIYDYGSFKIDSIYGSSEFHSQILYSRLNGIIRFGENAFSIQPEVGDSIYKVKGIFEYELIKKDSTYIESWSCNSEVAFIIDRWKNGEKKYIPSSNKFPQPGDTSNSIYIHEKD